MSSCCVLLRMSVLCVWGSRAAAAACSSELVTAGPALRGLRAERDDPANRRHPTGTELHGLSSNKMALITSDCGTMLLTAAIPQCTLTLSPDLKQFGQNPANPMRSPRRPLCFSAASLTQPSPGLPCLCDASHATLLQRAAAAAATAPRQQLCCAPPADSSTLSYVHGCTVCV